MYIFGIVKWVIRIQANFDNIKMHEKFWKTHTEIKHFTLIIYVEKRKKVFYIFKNHDFTMCLNKTMFLFWVFFI